MSVNIFLFCLSTRMAAVRILDGISEVTIMIYDVQVYTELMAGGSSRKRQDTMRQAFINLAKVCDQLMSD